MEKKDGRSRSMSSEFCQLFFNPSVRIPKVRESSWDVYRKNFNMVSKYSYSYNIEPQKNVQKRVEPIASQQQRPQFSKAQHLNSPL